MNAIELQTKKATQSLFTSFKMSFLSKVLKQNQNTSLLGIPKRMREENVEQYDSSQNTYIRNVTQRLHRVIKENPNFVNSEKYKSISDRIQILPLNLHQLTSIEIRMEIEDELKQEETNLSKQSYRTIEYTNPDFNDDDLIDNPSSSDGSNTNNTSSDLNVDRPEVTSFLSQLGDLVNGLIGNSSTNLDDDNDTESISDSSTSTTQTSNQTQPTSNIGNSDSDKVDKIYTFSLDMLRAFPRFIKQDADASGMRLAIKQPIDEITTSRTTAGILTTADLVNKYWDNNAFKYIELLKYLVEIQKWAFPLGIKKPNTEIVAYIEDELQIQGYNLVNEIHAIFSALPTIYWKSKPPILRYPILGDIDKMLLTMKTVLELKSGYIP